ncbi:MAG: dipeptidase [Marinilabiliales bacterium]
MRLVVFLFICITINNISAQTTDTELLNKAKEIHQQILSVDSHTDTPLRLYHDKKFDIGKKHKYEKDHSCVDIPRMYEGNLDAVFFAIFLGQGARNDSAYKSAYNKAVDIYNTIIKNIKKNNKYADLAKSPEDAYTLKKQNKKAIFLGIENGYAIGLDTSLIPEFYNMGVRYITLCHTKNNDICDSSTDTAEHHGLSPFGITVIEKMNEVGMMIDVSHISDEAFYDVIKYSKAPVIASHSCSRAICDNPRNMTDEMLKTLAKNGGVIQVCILSDYVKTPDPDPVRDSLKNLVRIKFRNFDNLSDKEMKQARKEWYAIDKKYPKKLANVSDVADHIDHIVKVIGIDHVGIGTDFDGGGGIEGCMDVSQMFNITIELLKRGYTKSDLEKLWGGNLMRVFNEVTVIANK